MTDRIEILERLNELLRLFGIANDADDHNCGPEGDQLRARGAAGIREVIKEHSFVIDLLPKLEWELDSGHIRGFGWSNLMDALEPEIRAARGGPAAE